MEVISLSERDQLSPDQKDFWDYLRPYACEPFGEQTREQAINLAVSTFLAWCHFERLGPETPTPSAIRAEFEAAGVPEDCPSAEDLEDWHHNPEPLRYLVPRPEKLKAVGYGPTAAAAMNYRLDAPSWPGSRVVRAQEGRTTVVFFGRKTIEAMKKQRDRKADEEES
jgi:hypothetical protein